MEPALEAKLRILEATGYAVTVGERGDGSWYAIARKAGDIRAVSGRTRLEAVAGLVRVLGFEPTERPRHWPRSDPDP